MQEQPISICNYQSRLWIIIKQTQTATSNETRVHNWAGQNPNACNQQVQHELSRRIHSSITFGRAAKNFAAGQSTSKNCIRMFNGRFNLWRQSECTQSWNCKRDTKSNCWQNAITLYQVHLQFDWRFCLSLLNHLVYSKTGKIWDQKFQFQQFLTAWAGLIARFKNENDAYRPKLKISSIGSNLYKAVLLQFMKSMFIQSWTEYPTFRSLEMAPAVISCSH